MNTNQASPTAPPPFGIPGAPSPQWALLSYFFPGLSVLTSVAHAYLGIDRKLCLPMLLGILVLALTWRYASELWSLVVNYLMSSVRIRTDDEVFNMMILWLSKQKFAQNSRHFFANTDIKSRSRYMYLCSDSDDEPDDDDDDGEAAVEAIPAAGRKNALHYTPAPGTHFFWYKGYPVMFERHLNREQANMQSASEREELSLSCLGRNPRLLKELLLEARQLHMKKDERKTLIYRGNLDETCWQRCMSRLNRPFSTVILNERVKQELLDDAADYLNPMTRRWYANRGIPYRRGYLLHGPPGTGKSSLSLALAGYFRMKIYIVSLSSASATEENITTLFNELPMRCIVLLEDIDSAGLTHTRDDASAASGSQDALAPLPRPRIPRTRATAASVGGRLSLSGLLNILDGVASQEGRILIMTTNHIEKLDKALIRPGRVDMIIRFGLADEDMVASIFRAIYAPYDNENALSSRPTPNPAGNTAMIRADYDSEAEERERAKERDRIRERVDVLAKRFAAEVPDMEFSPAEVQGLLLRHKRTPEEAIDAAGAWVAQMRKRKKEKAEQEAEERREEEGTESETKSEATTNCD
ncbi:Putative mitochondrial chaperone BCS1-B [Tolypocladium paradoxum]|uniref:Mitochondrial chaperone BCS1-B n=1 Tax=Tolypocladium paradoxum TaxID=94208 RepID=A0A2S4L4J4_9HYPO|nr:Putative mitochondrial chaperone BCS1-B [Tolypocladium paradoxum]